MTNAGAGEEGRTKPASPPEWPALNVSGFTHSDKRVPGIPQSDSYRGKGGQTSWSENTSCAWRMPATWSVDRHWCVQDLKWS